MIRPPLFLLAVLTVARSADVPLPTKIEYNRDVRPILADNCFRCHGFDKNKREGERRLDTRDGALAGHDGVRAIVPGDLAASDVHVRIRSKDKDEVMPPSKEHHQLNERQKAVLDRWIEQGAEYQAHWAYLAPVRPAVPAASERGFTRNALDLFIVARQLELGLKHALEADRATLARRLHFDLLGLPPRPEEVEAFVRDESANAYEKLVDRLLVSPHYGERMALMWLDLVRYADTIGYHSDVPRNVWAYRDYVIRAFNDNKPFDQFTLEQLAGDLLPQATREQKIASGFNRLNMTTEEGGAQAKQYEAKTVTDRVKAIGTAWLGQTFMCAECHDHKYDPITARDFYSLGAFFADLKESAIGRREEGMSIPTPEEEAKLKEFDTRLATLRRDLEATSPTRDEAQAAWESELANGPTDVEWTPLHPEKVFADRGSQLAVEEDESISVAVDGNAASDTYFVTVTTPPGLSTGFKLEALASESLPANGPGRAGDGDFVLNQFTIEESGTKLKIAEATATYERKGQPVSAVIAAKGKGWSVLGNAGNDAAAYFELAKPVAGGTTLQFTLRQTNGDHHTLGKFRLSATAAPKPIRAPNVQFPKDLVAAIKVAPEKRSEAQRAKIAKHFRNVAPEFADLREQLAATQVQRSDFEKTIARTLVSEATPSLRTVRILPRGDWMKDDGEAVQPALPHYLPQPKIEGRALTRLDLAEWLVSRENPLTARVFMNRLWAQFFGIGLSKTLEDLGTQAELPVNAPLLDWLACEFMDGGWNVRQMVRLMVTSGAYRQSSQAPRELLARDPENRDLARQSRFRLDAEFVRDNALAISGLLVPKIGGPSVKPYQPAGYWENLNFPVREWEHDKNENQWRRGLYTWWQRSYLHPSLAAFDAPTREECAASRMRSNIPQQALALLNDPTYVEAARAFAARIVKEGGATTDERIAWAWRQATARPPRPDEIASLRELLNKHASLYEHDADAAKELVKVGEAPAPKPADAPELAAWTSVARTILNLHETITRL